MANFEHGTPHTYYSILELSLMKDVRVMTNTKIKAIGFIQYRDGQVVLCPRPDSRAGVPLDLANAGHVVQENFPYIIFGFVHTINEGPIVTAKFIKKFGASIEELEIYHRQCLALRGRSVHFDDIYEIAKIKNWI